MTAGAARCRMHASNLSTTSASSHPLRDLPPCSVVRSRWIGLPHSRDACALPPRRARWSSGCPPRSPPPTHPSEPPAPPAHPSQACSRRSPSARQTPVCIGPGGQRDCVDLSRRHRTVHICSEVRPRWGRRRVPAFQLYFCYPSLSIGYERRAPSWRHRRWQSSSKCAALVRSFVDSRCLSPA